VELDSTVVEKSSTKQVNTSALGGLGGLGGVPTLNLGPFPWQGEKRRDKDIVTVNFGEEL